MISMSMPRYPCWAIQRQIMQLPPKPPAAMLSKDQSQLWWFDPVKKKLKLTPDWENATLTHRHEQRNSVKGCQHDGPCFGNRCSCFADNVLCEKLCACACACCPRKFTGCACHEQNKACSDNRCICRQLNRECDPDLCKSCGAVERADPQCQKPDYFYKAGCQNIELQIASKLKRRTIIGRTKLWLNSDTRTDGSGGDSGRLTRAKFYGLYAGEDIPAGAFIDEYVGEVISHYEADRWAQLLDKLDISYYFELNACKYCAM